MYILFFINEFGIWRECHCEADVAKFWQCFWDQCFWPQVSTCFTQAQHRIGSHLQCQDLWFWLDTVPAPSFATFVVRIPTSMTVDACFCYFLSRSKIFCLYFAFQIHYIPLFYTVWKNRPRHTKTSLASSKVQHHILQDNPEYIHTSVQNVFNVIVNQFIYSILRYERSYLLY